MLGISEKPKSEDGKNLIPISQYGIQCMSIGFMVDQDTRNDLERSHGYKCNQNFYNQCSLGQS